MCISLVDCCVEVPVCAASRHLDNHRNTKQLMILLRIRLITVIDLTLTERGREREREREGERGQGIEVINMQKSVSTINVHSRKGHALLSSR